MSIVRSTPLHVSLVALTSQGLAVFGARDSFQLDLRRPPVRSEAESCRADIGAAPVVSQSLRLRVIQADGDDSAAEALDLQVQSAAGLLVAGSRWGLQFGYPDPTSGP
jgi:hypothetical protein